MIISQTLRKYKYYLIIIYFSVKNNNYNNAWIFLLPDCYVYFSQPIRIGKVYQQDVL